MQIAIGSDHHGLALKRRLAAWLLQQGHDPQDFGTFCEEPIDYPGIAFAVAEAIHAGVLERGILICGTGLGMAIAANKVPGVFAAPAADAYTARLARQSNNAQILTLGANVVGPGLAVHLVEVWLAAEFRGGDSARKVGQIRAFEARLAWAPGPAGVPPVGVTPCQPASSSS